MAVTLACLGNLIDALSGDITFSTGLDLKRGDESTETDFFAWRETGDRGSCSRERRATLPLRR